MTKPARHVRNVAQAGGPHHQFLKLHTQELFALSVLPAWTMRLFAALVMFSNFRTGAGCVHYAQLCDALRPIQPLHGGPRHDEYSVRQVRDALLRFEQAKILARKTYDSEQAGALFFVVSKRAGNFVQPRVA